MFTLSFKTDNAAFDDETGGAAEIVRILREVANRVEDETFNGQVFDSNGNRVGTWETRN
jgi:hypothetical protein